MVVTVLDLKDKDKTSRSPSNNLQRQENETHIIFYKIKATMEQHLKKKSMKESH